ncbi:MAG: YihY/virulence factor BrkB family protein [Bacteroidales bacterium]
MKKKIKETKQKWTQRYLSILRYFTYEIWYDRVDLYSYWKRLGIYVFKILSIAYKKFFKDKCLNRASALSYYSILAVVPILAIAFGVAKGFGMDVFLADEINKLSSQSIFWQSVFTFTRSMLDNTSGGLIAGIGLFFLLWVAMNVLTSVELALNDIWQVKRQRTILRKFTDYTTIILLTPVLIVVGYSAKLYLQVHVTDVVNSSFVLLIFHYLMALTPFISISIFFTLLYLILPNTRIPLRASLIAGLVSSLFFMIMKDAYIQFQSYMTSYNIVYGSFAALPLFLIWLRISWIIVLFGAELGFSIVKMDNYIFETDYKYISERRRKIYALYLTTLVAHNFKQEKGAMSIVDLSKIMCVPQPYLYDVAKDLTEMKILNRIYANDRSYSYEACYQPAYDINKLSLQQVLQALDFYHYEEEFIPKSQEPYYYFDDKMNQINALISQSSHNVLLKDIDLHIETIQN